MKTIKDADHGFTLTLFHLPEDETDDNIDVEVALANGERYTATLFTPKNITTLMTRYQETGECLYGKYFWATELVIIRDLKLSSIHEAVADMLKNGELFRAFGGPYGPDPD
jgi:hypothetical protein